jgi:hypothetical protein
MDGENGARPDVEGWGDNGCDHRRSMPRLPRRPGLVR